MLLLAAGQAHAEMPVCTGKDMMAELATNDPALLAKIEQEAAATLNGKGLLWKIETPGGAPSYLFGTMHMTDPRVTHLTPQRRSRRSTAPAPWSSRPPKCSTRPSMMAAL